MNSPKVIRNIILLFTVVAAVYLLLSLNGVFDQKPSSTEDVYQDFLETLGGDFTLTNQFGEKTSLRDFRGKYVLLTFGYTHCPDICPTVLMDLDQVMTGLGDLAAKVQVVFVTLDPVRDTPEYLRDYLQHFNPGFIGLSGTLEEIDTVASLYKVAYEKGPVDENGQYSVGHSAYNYLSGPDGKVLEMFHFSTPPNEIADYLRVSITNADP